MAAFGGIPSNTHNTYAEAEARARETAAAKSRQLQQQIWEDQLMRNKVTASNMAIQNSRDLQQVQTNPRTVNDDSMSISNSGIEGVGSGSTRSASTGRSMGGFGTQVPQIDGRYMSLVEYQQPTLSQPNAAQVQMGEGNFTPADATAYQDAAFARLKDKSGSLGQGALQTLAAQLAGRGISGQSGTFGRGLVDTISRAVQPLSDLNVEHLGQEYGAAQRAQELSAQRENAIYQGNISQRGQDMAAQQAMNNLLAQIAQLKYQGEISQKQSQLAALERMLY